MKQDVEQYIKKFPEEVQERLQEIRAAIQKAAPEATECISYGIPTFKQNGNLVHYGGFKKHIGFFPTAKGIADFAEELKNFPTSKGTVQFLHDRPLPFSLIAKIVRHRLKENKKSVKKNKSPIKQQK